MKNTVISGCKGTTTSSISKNNIKKTNKEADPLLRTRFFI